MVCWSMFEPRYRDTFRCLHLFCVWKKPPRCIQWILQRAREGTGEQKVTESAVFADDRKTAGSFGTHTIYVFLIPTCRGRGSVLRGNFP